MPVGSSFWIAEGMLGGAIENFAGSSGHSPLGFRFRLRNQFLHGHHPLGWIRAMEVRVDGRGVALSALALVVREQWVAARNLPTIDDIWWRMGETILVAVEQPGGLPPGLHDIELNLEVSSLSHTAAVDRQDLYPAIAVELAARLPVADGLVGLGRQ